MEQSKSLAEFNQKMKGVAHDFATQVQENEADFKQFMKDLDAYHTEGRKLLKFDSFEDFVDEIRGLIDWQLMSRGEVKEVKRDFNERFKQAFMEYQQGRTQDRGMQM
jgi:hypothetical protein